MDLICLMGNGQAWTLRPTTQAQNAIQGFLYCWFGTLLGKGHVSSQQAASAHDRL
jgi:hypothetical protein